MEAVVRPTLEQPALPERDALVLAGPQYYLIADVRRDRRWIFRRERMRVRLQEFQDLRDADLALRDAVLHNVARDGSYYHVR